MKVVPPVVVTDAMLTASTVAETDHPEWVAGTTYPQGYRVILAATHRIYESVVAGNVGHDPAAGDIAWWIDVGATNRWAVFDEAVGSATLATGSFAVTLEPGIAVDTVAVLDTDAAQVRVEIVVGVSTIHDETIVRGVDQVNLVFPDLPENAGARIIITLSAASGGASVSAGTIIIGSVFMLGMTETNPSIGINDFSRRTTDDFGVTTITERGWAKRMSIRTLIDTDSVDLIQRRLAGLRARPCLWIGESDYDSLTIYGFFKDFSIDLALATSSYCTLTIEGLTAQAPLAPMTVTWSNVTDDGGKPEDGATVGAPEGTVVGTTPAEDIEGAVTGGLNPDGTVKPDMVGTGAIQDDAVSTKVYLVAATSFSGSGSAPSTAMVNVITYSLVLDQAATVLFVGLGVQSYSGSADFGAHIVVDGVTHGSIGGGAGIPIPTWTTAPVVSLAAGTHMIEFAWRGSAGVTLQDATLYIQALKK